MDTRYSYFWLPGQTGTRDAYVLSIARRFDKEKSFVEFGWALNVPPRWMEYNDGLIKGHKLIPGDHFSRKAGRKIAEERLRKVEDKKWNTVEPEELPIEVVLMTVAEDPSMPRMAQEIAEKELVRRAKKPSLLDRFMNLFR